MEKNQDQSAFPLLYDGGNTASFCYNGLTKLEYFTAKILPSCYMGVGHEEESAKRALAMAIVMLNEIGKPITPTK